MQRGQYYPDIGIIYFGANIKRFKFTDINNEHTCDGARSSYINQYSG